MSIKKKEREKIASNFMFKAKLVLAHEMKGIAILKRCCLLFFSDGHVLQLWSETVAVRRHIYGLVDI